MTNVIVLPRPAAARPESQALGLYLRVGRNDHLEVGSALLSGHVNCLGTVVNAVHVKRHKELLDQVSGLSLDTVLDPRTQQSAEIGGYTDALGSLPWGLERKHVVQDFEGSNGKSLVRRLGEFVLEHGFSQVIAPTHIIRTPEDRWLARDIETTGWLKEYLGQRSNPQTLVIYSLAIPHSLLRNAVQRKHLIKLLRDAPFDALWLKIEDFGSTSSPTKTQAFLDACADFYELDVPVVADHVGGLVGLGLLSFGAVGGITHGVTLNERFDGNYLRRPRDKGKARSMPRRVYFRDLDLMLKPSEARMLLESSMRARSIFACRDPHCCPRGVQDMLENPGRHFLYQRSQQIKEIGDLPRTLRPQEFLEKQLRPASDKSLVASNINFSFDKMGTKLREHRKRIDLLRITLGQRAAVTTSPSYAQVPASRLERSSDRRTESLR